MRDQYTATDHCTEPGLRSSTARMGRTVPGYVYTTYSQYGLCRRACPKLVFIKVELMQVYEHQGKFIVDFSEHRHFDIVDNLDIMTQWCRATWGDTDHRTNPDYKWRRRIQTFYFTKESHRTLFLIRFPELKLAEPEYF